MTRFDIIREDAVDFHNPGSESAQKRMTNLSHNVRVGYMVDWKWISIAEARRLLPVGQKFIRAHPTAQSMETAHVSWNEMDVRVVTSQGATKMESELDIQPIGTTAMYWHKRKVALDLNTGWIHVCTMESPLDVAYLPLEQS